MPPAVLRHLACAQPARYPALLDSVVAGPLGRMSILAAAPTASLSLSREGRLSGEGMTPDPAATGFLNALECWWQAEAGADEITTPMPVPGWIVFLAYEMAGEIEPHLALPPTPLPWQALALRTPCALVHVLASNEVWAIAEPGAEAALEAVMAEARALAPSVTAEPEPGAQPEFRVHEEDPARYLERVRRAKEYISAGDIYQANLSRPWRIEAAAGGALKAADLYASLRQRNPAPFAALLQWQEVALLSSSPERLLRVHEGEVDTRPIAGTRPRTHAPGGDMAEAAALVAHPKERAEHIMLIDLERNDLGKVCEAGTVEVDELMVTETYAHVHHIVSNVRGRLRPSVTPIGALRATFPGGTITGVPKFRCMQIIAELEGEGRGAYTGSLGYLTRGGLMDLNILIRTMTLMDGRVSLRAGGGIVADSDPERELNETRAKARGMLRVFEAAGKTS